MGATTTYALPYPENGADVDVPYDVKQLADAVDARLVAMGADSGWIDVVIAGGFVAQAGAEKPQVRKIGRVVYMRGGWLAGAGNGILAASSSYNIGTVPAGYRPPAPVVAACGSSAGAAVCSLHVQADGVVQIRTSGTLGAYYKADGRSWTID